VAVVTPILAKLALSIIGTAILMFLSFGFGLSGGKGLRGIDTIYFLIVAASGFAVSEIGVFL
jgi:hypothetical protein